MGFIAVTGATCACCFGGIPCSLNVTSQMTCLADGRPAGTIMDMQPGTNLAGFGMCASLANPAVAAATAAALGVLTPQPCTFAPAGTWIPANPKVLLGGKPVLTSDATLICALGAGNIKIVSPGQTKVLL
ncbi:MAG: DUF4280 domain-containing protein [Muribaculaceae bacterium]|nr:DUF4280 domain-containing protein [Roseburia sp.]MCM1430138.1 DUF4280 domain-containing protein [Muribaculaceae bacterium]MCM1493069.1 DUF4280 domain-containing protein [Muribaculaceae bacterium]